MINPWAVDGSLMFNDGDIDSDIDSDMLVVNAW